MLVLVSTPVKVLAAKVFASGMLRSWSTPEPCLPVLLAAQDTFIKLNVLRNDFVVAVTIDGRRDPKNAPSR